MEAKKRLTLDLEPTVQRRLKAIKGVSMRGYTAKLPLIGS